MPLSLFLRFLSWTGLLLPVHRAYGNYENLILKTAVSKVCLRKCGVREVYGKYYEFMELSFSLLPAASSFFSLHLAID